jgi:hypothetical protein
MRGGIRRQGDDLLNIAIERGWVEDKKAVRGSDGPRTIIASWREASSRGNVAPG